MEYIYFGLVPILIAGWLVWRQHYAPMRETSWAHSLTYLLVIIAYSVLFNIIAGILTSLLVALIYLAWSKAVMKDRHKNYKG